MTSTTTPRVSTAPEWSERTYLADRACCYGARPRAFDHVHNLTRRSDRAKGVLLMPYGFNDGDAAELTAWCDTRGVEWSTTGPGWWYPGTVAVVITRRSAEKTGGPSDSGGPDVVAAGGAR